MPAPTVALAAIERAHNVGAPPPRPQTAPSVVPSIAPSIASTSSRIQARPAPEPAMSGDIDAGSVIGDTQSVSGLSVQRTPSLPYVPFEQLD